MSGRVGDLSEDQASKLAQLKEALSEVLHDRHDDIWLLRFLRASRFDVRKSESLFRKDIEWRKKMNFDKLKKGFVPPEVLRKYWGGGMIGYELQGSVVYVLPFGKRDGRGLLKSCKGSDLEKANILLAEEMLNITEELNKKHGKDVGGALQIVDLEGIGKHTLWKPWIDRVVKDVRILEQHYPEFYKKTVLINAPTVFSIFYNLCKPVLNEATKQKIAILGSDWKSQLLKLVDADVLPACYGGNRVDPDGDPRCPSVMKPAEVVPESYNLTGKDISTKSKQTQVPARRTLELKYDVHEPGSVLSYEFKTLNADLGFGVAKINEDGKQISIVENERHNCYLVPEDGQVTLDEPGTYVVIFDNSYGLFRSKTLSYFIEILPPITTTDQHLKKENESED